MYIVSGDYFDGQLETLDASHRQAVWRRACFIAPTPFHPLDRQVGQFAMNATILDYLDRLGAKGVGYRYAWWDHPGWIWTIWLGGSVVVIGILWPTVINLIAFGSVWRPRGEHVNIFQSKSAAGPALEAGGVDLTDVVAIGDAMEAKLAAGGGEALAGTEGEAAGNQTRPLSAAEPLRGSVPPTQTDKEFGAGRDDFYPTERAGRAGDK